ncbi:MAG: hypothetical protein GQ564_16800 [Bacteroidales bacterium]|nr:hypothetical protein [Bacteroidales bacterium]
MKTIFTILITILLNLLIFLPQMVSAQSPDKMSYQAVLRNSSDQLVINQSVGMQISILQGSETGTEVYVEIQNPTSNANGLVSIKIGTGTTNDDFSNINWANGPYYIKTETDINGGANYSISGVSLLLSVPYALHAKTAESISGGITETDPEFIAWDKSTGITISENQISDLQTYLTTEADGDVTNEIQDLNLIGDVLTITNNVGATEINLAPFIGTNTDDQALSLSTNTLSLEDGGTVDLSGYLDDTDTHLTENEVDAIVNNNGYLTTVEVIQGRDISANAPANGQVLKWDNTSSKWLPSDDALGAAGTTDGVVTTAGVVGTTTKTITLSRSESLGDLTANFTDMVDDADADATNEIQDISLTGNNLSITSGSTVDLSVIQDGTGTDDQTLSEILTGSTSAGTHKISDLVDPTSNQDAATKKYVDGIHIIGNENVVIAKDAGSSLTTSSNNILIGQRSGESVTSSNGNVFIGGYAATFMTGTYNTAIGYLAGNNATTGNQNTYLGTGSGENGEGDQNVMVGYGAGRTNTLSHNTMIGPYAGGNGDGESNIAIGLMSSYMATGSNNIAIGKTAGFYETGDDKLYITNTKGSDEASGRTDAFIYGDMTAKILNFGATVSINNSYTLPNSDGTTGQVLSTDGSGNVNWGTVSAGTDDQAISLSGNTLTLEDGGTADLSGYIDNTDAQDLSLSGTTLSLTGDVSSVDLSGYLDNTDTHLTEAEVDAYAGNNGYLTTVEVIQGRDVSANAPANGQVLKWDNTSSKWLPSDDALGAAGTTDGVVTSAGVAGTTTKTITISRSESLGDLTANFTDMVDDADADATNEIQDISLTGNNLSISSGSAVDLSVIKDGYEANTDNQDLTLSGTTLTLTGDATTVDLSSLQDGYEANTDAQTLSLSGTDLTIVGGNTLDVSSIQDGYDANTDNQDLTFSGTTLTLTGDATTVNLSSLQDGYEANTDAQTLSLSGTDLTIAGGNTLDVSSIQDGYDANTDNQDLTLSGTTLNLTGDGSSVDLSGLQDGTGTDDQTLSEILAINTSAGTHKISNVVDPTLNQDASTKKYVDDQIAIVSGGSTLVSANGLSEIDVQNSYIQLGVNKDALNRRILFYENRIEVRNLYENIFMGRESGLNQTTSAEYNTSFGNLSLKSQTTADNNTAIGYGSGLSITTGGTNTFLGSESGYNITDGSNNLFSGYKSGFNMLGNYNVVLGSYSGSQASSGTGDDNVLIGVSSGTKNNGNRNVAIGRWSLSQNTSENNVAIGYAAGQNTTSTSGNVFIGYGAGYMETESNKFYISNAIPASTTLGRTEALIYGDFNAKELNLNSSVTINNEYTLPTTDGNAGDVVTTNGLGNVTWKAPTKLSDLTSYGNDDRANASYPYNTSQDMTKSGTSELVTTITKVNGSSTTLEVEVITFIRIQNYTANYNLRISMLVDNSGADFGAGYITIPYQIANSQEYVRVHLKGYWTGMTSGSKSIKFTLRAVDKYDSTVGTITINPLGFEKSIISKEYSAE